MANVVGPRGTFGVIVPSTNTVVEAEYNWMAPEGISLHAGRIMINFPNLDSDEAFETFLVDLRKNIGAAVESVMTCNPDRLVMGMSAETFWGGKEGNAKFEALIKEYSGGMSVVSGAEACSVALDALGARRIGVITPYQPVGDEQVEIFFTESGYEVLAIEGLKCPTATSIAEVTAEQITAAFERVDVEGTDALVQAGTNLAAVKAAAALEKRLGKPVLAINAATFWRALRLHGIKDKVAGFGRLLEEH